jgi:hypothetical protein
MVIKKYSSKRDDLYVSFEYTVSPMLGSQHPWPRSQNFSSTCFVKSSKKIMTVPFLPGLHHGAALGPDSIQWYVHDGGPFSTHKPKISIMPYMAFPIIIKRYRYPARVKGFTGKISN